MFLNPTSPAFSLIEYFCWFKLLARNLDESLGDEGASDTTSFESDRDWRESRDPPSLPTPDDDTVGTARAPAAICKFVPSFDMIKQRSKMKNR